jgi:hypothetical protein
VFGVPTLESEVAIGDCDHFPPVYSSISKI